MILAIRCNPKTELLKNGCNIDGWTRKKKVKAGPNPPIVFNPGK
jgi:hypothetical protein